ncbi:MAG: hypothetical protein ISS92_01970 [Candidatus Omnitrophica bacterium]|nr:hypothetical protein [Candidatus Omnitrophota bacterium]
MLIFVNAFALDEVSLSATGNDWLEFSEEQKAILMGMIFNALKVGREHKAQDGVKALDRFYSRHRMFRSDPTKEDSAKEDKLLERPCIKIVEYLLAE